MTKFLVFVSCFVLARNPSCFKTLFQATLLPFLREGKCWPALSMLVQTSPGLQNYIGFWLRFHEVDPTEKLYIFPGSFGIPLQSFFKPALTFPRIRSVHESVEAIQRTLASDQPKAVYSLGM